MPKHIIDFEDCILRTRKVKILPNEDMQRKLEAAIHAIRKYVRDANIPAIVYFEDETIGSKEFSSSMGSANRATFCGDKNIITLTPGSRERHICHELVHANTRRVRGNLLTSVGFIRFQEPIEMDPIYPGLYVVEGYESKINQIVKREYFDSKERILTESITDIIAFLICLNPSVYEVIDFYDRTAILSIEDLLNKIKERPFFYFRMFLDAILNGKKLLDLNHYMNITLKDEIGKTAFKKWIQKLIQALRSSNIEEFEVALLSILKGLDGSNKTVNTTRFINHCRIASILRSYDDYNRGLRKII